MKLKIYSADGSSFEEKDIETIPCFEGDKGVRALKDLIIAIQANLRQGNACAKTRAEVSGTGKKPWRQKGTGMARHGSKRSPIWRGGGAAHGPRPRDYSQNINRKVKSLAFARAVYDAAENGTLAIIKEIESIEPKTKVMANILNNIVDKGSILLVDEFFKDNVMLAARNLQDVYMIASDSLNAWDVVRHKLVLVSERGFTQILNRLNNEG